MTPIIEKIRSSSRNLVRELQVFQDAYQDTNFSLSQCHILFEIKNAQQLNLGDLSEIIQLDKSTTSRLVKKLVENDYLKVNKLEGDLRQKWFSLTPKGAAATACNESLANQQVQQALSQLTQEEQQKIKEGLQLYSKALRQSRLQQDYELRRIQQSDNPQVAKLIRGVMTEFGAVGEGYSIMDPEVDHMYEAYSTDNTAFFVIEKDGKILGGGGVGPLQGGDPQTCELKKMYFYPELRGLGFGKTLVQKCLQAARELGYTGCYLETIERMWQANLLYQRMGFKELKEKMGNTGHCACELKYFRKID